MRTTSSAALVRRAGVALLLATLTHTASYAQSPDPAAPTVAADGRLFETFKTRLKLTPEQEEQIRPILQDETGKLRAIRDKYEGQTSRRAKRSMLKDAKGVRDDARKRIEPLLTEEQKAEWKKLREEMRERARVELKRR